MNIMKVGNTVLYSGSVKMQDAEGGKHEKVGFITINQLFDVNPNVVLSFHNTTSGSVISERSIEIEFINNSQTHITVHAGNTTNGHPIEENKEVRMEYMVMGIDVKKAKIRSKI